MTIDNYFYPLLSFIPALLNAGIVIYIVFFLPKGKTTDIFTLFIIALIFWQLEDTVVRICDSEEITRKWDRIFSIGWVSFAPLAFHFICRYASLKIIYNRLFVIAIYLPFFIFFLMHISNDALVFKKQGHWGWINRPPPLSPEGLMRFVISAYVMMALSILLHYAYTMRNNKEKKLQAYIMAVAIFIPASQGILLQVIYPLVFKQDEIPLTSAFLTFFSAGTILALKKYRMFKIEESVAVEKVFENMKQIVLILSPNEKIFYTNAYTKNLFGLKDKELASTTMCSFFENEAVQNSFAAEVMHKALQGQSVKSHTTRLRIPNDTIDVLLSAEPIINNKVLMGVLIVGNDITEQVTTLQALKESNDRFHLISTTTNDMVWDWDLITGKVYRNKEGWRKLFEDILDTELGEEQDWYVRLHPDDLWTIDYMKKQIEAGMPNNTFEIEFKLIRKDGSIAYVTDRGYAVRDENGKPIRLIGATQDITLRKQTEFRLREEQAIKHKQITEAVIRAQEKERNFLGAELHDNVNQILTSAQLYLNLANNEKVNKTAFIQQAEKILGTAIREIRKLSHTLIPPTLSSQTLVEALDNLMDMTEKGGTFTIVRNYYAFNEEGMSDKKKLTLYRIVQEQMNNVVKYACATEVHVHLKNDENFILLSIQDDGVGFDTTLKSNGVGLTNIKTRAALHNGDMKIISAPNQGCILEVCLPTVAEQLV